MTNAQAIGLIIGICDLALIVYVLLDRNYQNRLDAVAGGFVEGRPIPTKYREMLLHSRLLPFILIVVSALVVWIIGLLLLAREIADENVTLLAYLASFLFAIGALGWLSLGAVQYFHLRSLLSQAEAD